MLQGCMLRRCLWPHACAGRQLLQGSSLPPNYIESLINAILSGNQGEAASLFGQGAAAGPEGATALASATATASKLVCCCQHQDPIVCTADLEIPGILPGG